MYRNFVAQHGYDVFDIGTTKGTILQVMYRNFDAQHGYKFFELGIVLPKSMIS